MERQNSLRVRQFAGAVAACAAAALLLGGCGGAATPSAARAKAAPADSGRLPAAAMAGDGAHAGSGHAAIFLAAGSDIVYTATLTVRAHDIPSQDAKAKQIVAGVGGYVSSESTSLDPAHPSRSTANLQLKIPVDAYPATLNSLATQLGTQVSLQQQAQDVTENVANVSSRVASAQAALAQLRALLGHAGSVSDLLSIQDQISQQEADLESLQAQQRALNHETAYATLSLRLIGVPPAATSKRHGHTAGFLRGLNAGWLALRWFASRLLALVGLLIPFALLIAAAGYLAFRCRRWLLARRTPPPATE